MKKYTLILALILMIIKGFAFAQEVRIKDVARVASVRDNQLIGYGLVVGLKGTGDGRNTQFTIQSLVAMLEKMGVKVSETNLKVKNVAAVIVTANYPAFAKSGSKLDITVSSLGDAASLEGGILLQTPLKGADENVYAVAQGPIILGGGKNVVIFPTVGRIPNGAIVEREIDFDINNFDKIKLVLENIDFTSAVRMSQAINTEFQNTIAKPLDAGTVEIEIPKFYQKNSAITGFIASLEDLTFTPDNTAKVVINELTGTVVSGQNVRISKVALSHGDLNVTVFREKLSSDGKKKEQEPYNASVMPMEESTTVSSLADALNKLGVTPKDIVSIFQALKKAGALHAELIII